MGCMGFPTQSLLYKPRVDDEKWFSKQIHIQTRAYRDVAFGPSGDYDFVISPHVNS